MLQSKSFDYKKMFARVKKNEKKCRSRNHTPGLTQRDLVKCGEKS
jgi:hypothetical protein